MEKRTNKKKRKKKKEKKKKKNKQTTKPNIAKPTMIVLLLYDRVSEVNI